MIDMLKLVISLAFALPFVSLVIFFIILRVVIKNKKKSILWAVDLSTFPFIVSVHFHLLTIFEQSFLIYIICALVCIALIVIYVDYKRLKAPPIKSISKKVWRLSFLFFFVSYLILTVYGMTTGMIKHAFI